MTTYRLGRGTGVLVALTVAVAGCGFDPREAPVDAATKDFCGAYARVAGAGTGASAGDLAAYLEELAHFGTPPGIPSSARKGFEYVIDPAHAFASAQQFTALASQKDTAGLDAAALKAYYTQVC